MQSSGGRGPDDDDAPAAAADDTTDTEETEVSGKSTNNLERQAIRSKPGHLALFSFFFLLSFLTRGRAIVAVTAVRAGPFLVGNPRATS